MERNDSVVVCDDRVIALQNPTGPVPIGRPHGGSLEDGWQQKEESKMSRKSKKRFVGFAALTVLVGLIALDVSRRTMEEARAFSWVEAD